MATRHNVPPLKKIGGVYGTLICTISDVAEELGISDAVLHKAIGSPNSPTVRKWMEELAKNGKPATPQTPTLDLSGIIPAGWKVVGEIAPAILSSPGELEGACFHRDRENLVNGEEMIRRAPEHEADLGFADLKLCIDRQSEIPEELRGKYIVFSKAIARRSGIRLAFYLYWSVDDGRWYVNYYGLGADWNRGHVLGRRRKSAA